MRNHKVKDFQRDVNKAIRRLNKELEPRFVVSQMDRAIAGNGIVWFLFKVVDRKQDNWTTCAEAFIISPKPFNVVDVIVERVKGKIDFFVHMFD